MGGLGGTFPGKTEVYSWKNDLLDEYLITYHYTLQRNMARSFFFPPFMATNQPIGTVGMQSVYPSFIASNVHYHFVDLIHPPKVFG
jgi:hypothetical protein